MGDTRVEVNWIGGMNFWSISVVTPNPKILNFGVASVNTTDKLGSVGIATTRVGRPTSSLEWRQHLYDIKEVTADILRKTKANSNYIFKIYFETIKEIQYFEEGNIYMSHQTLDSATIG